MRMAGRRWWGGALAAWVGIAGSLLPTPRASAQSPSSGCSGVALSVASAAVGPGQTATLAITAGGAVSPGIAGFQFNVAFDPTIATVTGVQGGSGFPKVAANLQTAPQGSVSVAGAGAAGVTGDPVLAVLTVRASSAAPVGSSEVFQLQDVSLVDAGPGAVTACPASGGNLAISSGPVVTALTPPAGAAAGGTTVNIQGSGFTGATAVRFGGLSAAQFTVVGDGQITAVSPPGSGTADVTVTTPLGTSPVGRSDRFTYAAASGPTLLLLPADSAAPTGEAALLTALLLDAGGSPEAGQTIRFTPTGSAAISAAVATTDGSGQAVVYLSDAVAETVQVTASASGVQAVLAVAFTHLPPLGATGALPGGGVSVAPATALPLVGSVLGGSQVDFAPAGAPPSGPLNLALTVPGGQAASIVGQVSGTVEAAADATALIQQSSGIQLAVGAPSVAGASTFAGPVVDFQTSGAASQLFGDETSGVTNPAIQVTLPFDPGALAPGQTPGVFWLDTAQSPPVWTDQGVAVVAVGADSVTALLPHLSLYTVIGVSLRTASAVTLETSPAGTLTATVDDQNGQPLPGVSVAFAATVGQLSAPSAVTDAQGQATVQWTASAAGSGTATASVAGVPQQATTTVVFTGEAAGGPSPRITTFPDVPPGYWAAPDIAALAAAGVVGGFPDGTFQPEAPVTRAQFAQMLVLTMGLKPGAGASGFSDVAATDWFAPYVSAAVAAGIVTGLTPTTFGPDRMLTREQMAVLLARALHLTQVTALHFTDDPQIDPWAAGGVGSTVAAGYITGFPDGTFQPLGTTTRAQAAKVLAMVLKGQGSAH